MIGIIGAMQAEIDGLLSGIEDMRRERVGSFDFAVGRIGNNDVVVARSGVGKVNAAVCAQTMILTYAPEVIINSGVAGSLSPRLDILDVAVATDAVQHDYDTTGLGEPTGALSINGSLVTHLPCDPVLRKRLLSAAGAAGVRAVPARVASGDQFIIRREVKQHIVDTFGAEACEMEGAAIAQACCLSGVPCAILRAISDSTDENHHMEYAEFMPRAAANTVKILMALLR